MKVVDFILERRMHDHAVVFMTCSSFIPLNPVGKSEGVRFCKFGTQNTVPCCQKCTPTECFFGDFASTGKEILVLRD